MGERTKPLCAASWSSGFWQRVDAMAQLMGMK
jgi:hypothetical protein